MSDFCYNYSQQRGGKQGEGPWYSPRGPVARTGDNGFIFAMKLAPTFAQSGRERDEEEVGEVEVVGEVEEVGEIEVAAVVDS